MALQLWFPLEKNAYNYGAQKVVGYITPEEPDNIVSTLPVMDDIICQHAGGVFDTYFAHPAYENFAPVTEQLVDDSIEVIQEFTASVWCKSFIQDNSATGVIYDISPHLSAFESVAIFLETYEDLIDIVLCPEDSYFHDNFKVNVPSLFFNQWRHVAFVYNHPSIKVYLDGQLVSEFFVEHFNLLNHRYSFWFDLTENWASTDWRFYDTALNDQQILDLYNRIDNDTILYELGLITTNDATAPQDPIPEPQDPIPQPPKPQDSIPEPPKPIMQILSDYIEWYYRITSANAPHLMNIPTTDKIYDIDINTRLITPPKNVGLTSDQRAEIIYFKINRFYEGHDLSKAVGIIEYINAANEKHFYGIPFYDITTFAKYDPKETYDEVTYEQLHESEQMVFPWVISSDVTRQAGNVIFAISFWILNDTQEESIFRLNLLPAKTFVQEGIEIDSRIESLIDNITLPTVEQLLILFNSITDDDYAITWDQGTMYETETERPYLERMTLPQ